MLDFYTKKNEKCRQSKDTEFLRTAIEKNNKYIEDIKIDLEKLNNNLENEQEIDKEKSDILLRSQVIVDNKEKKEKIKHKKKTSDDIKKEKTYQTLRKQRRTENWDKKKYGRYYNKFCDNVGKLPKNIENNLTNMPNNKGYIYRGIYFFGKNLPEENEPVIMFEKVYNKFYINKFYPGKTELYCKKNGKVTFVSEKPHKKKFIQPADWPEIKYAKKAKFKNYSSSNSYKNNRKPRRNKNGNETSSTNNRFNKKRILKSWNK